MKVSKPNPFLNVLIRYLNESSLEFLRKKLASKRISWQGKINAELKKKYINNYKYHFVIENSSDFKGYITDKIFETFYSGTVPVYLGAENISTYIPENCFINLRDFNNVGDLYKYLSTIKEDSYDEILKNIEIFLESKESDVFSYQFFCKIIFDILDRYNN